MKLPFADDGDPATRAARVLLVVVLETLRRAGAFERCVVTGEDGPVITNMLERGSSGAAVRRWQEYLIAAGQRLSADGAFGPLTEAATLAVTGERVVTPERYAESQLTQQQFVFEGLTGDVSTLAAEAAAILYPKG